MENNNTNNRAGIITIIVALLVILLGAGTYLYYHKAEAPTTGDVEMPGESAILASNCGLTVDNPQNGANVSFPLTVTGTINNESADSMGCAWTMFEGQAGKAELFYETKDGYSLPVDTEAITVANWMSTSSTFSATLDFDNSVLQLPAGYNFKIVLTEEDPSGMGNEDVVEIPVVLQ